MSTSTTLAKNRKTPGVYITEFPSFPPSIVGMPTAVPIFIGYTETAVDPSSGQQMYLTAVQLSSLSDYNNYFGGDFDAKGVVEFVDNSTFDAKYDFQAVVKVLSGTDPKALVDQTDYFSIGTSLAPADALQQATEMAEEGKSKIKTIAQFNLYSAMQMFFKNGGGNCYVVSVSNYWGKQSVLPTPEADPVKISATELQKGLDVSAVTRGPTMLLVPDACLFPKEEGKDGQPDTYPGYSDIAVEMLRQSKKLQDRVAILDLPGALDAENWSATGMAKQAKIFYTAISAAAEAFSYGAAYGPALQSSLMTSADILYNNLSGSAESTVWMNSLLTSQAYTLYPPGKDGKLSEKFQDVAEHIAAAFPVAKTETTDFGDPGSIVATMTAAPKQLVSLAPAKPNPALNDTPAARVALDQYLENATPLLSKIEQILATQLNVVPPSGALAGIWTLNDNNRGVWNAPANMTLNNVIYPMVDLTDAEQGDFNVPLSGNAIDILRSMVNRGTVVWGARTLDGNSLDYRYIQVRRTLNYIEQSIKQALQQYVFAANDGGTWTTVTAAISNFLTQLWQSGGLMGDKASDAFTVNCGVPTTMSGLDVLNGYMIVNVTVQLIHPAEFIELTFMQTMQGV